MFNLTRNPKRILLSLALSLLIGLMTFTAVYAVFVNIVTTDGVVDSNWALTTQFLTDTTGDAATSGYDILDFWVGTDASSPTEFYFRASLDAPIPLGGFLEARLDCNGDGDFVDSVDVVVDYARAVGIQPEAVDVWSGDISAYDAQLDTFGETTSTNFVYEWKASTSGPNVDWTACKANPLNVMLATVDADTGDDVDFTDTIRGYNVPTAVNLQRFDSVATSRSFLAITLVSVLLLVGLVFVSSIRPK